MIRNWGNVGARISDDGMHKTIHGHGANAAAIAYVELRLGDGSTPLEQYEVRQTQHFLPPH